MTEREPTSRWNVTTIDDIKADEPSSVAIGPFGSRMKRDLYVPDGVPVIMGRNLSDTRSFKGPFVFVSDITADELRSSNVQAGDLVFPHRGSIGSVGIVPRDGRDRYMLSTSLMKLRCNTRVVDPGFVYYFFRSSQGREELLKYASTVGTPGIGQPLTSLRSVHLPLPPLGVQHTIASVLGSLDNKINLNERTAKLCGSLASSLFAGAETCDVPLSEIAGVVMGQSPPGSTYNEERNGLPFYQGRRDFGYRFPSERIWCSTPTRLAERHDVLLSLRAPVGALNVARSRCAIGRGVAAIRSVGFPSTLFHALDSDASIWAPYEQEGTVFGSIGKDQVNDLTVNWPKTDADHLESVLAVLDDMVESLDGETDRLVAIFDTLLPKLLTGELRIRDTESLAEESA
jgi:type I restriction enzyme S subunit